MTRKQHVHFKDKIRSCALKNDRKSNKYQKSTQNVKKKRDFTFKMMMPSDQL